MFGINKEMTGTIERVGGTPLVRMMLFVGICVPLRLAIAVGAARLHTRPGFASVVVAGSLAAIYTTTTVDPGSKVWWVRRVHAAHALAILLLALTKPEFVSYALFSDVLFGILTSMVQMPFRPPLVPLR